MPNICEYFETKCPILEVFDNTKDYEEATRSIINYQKNNYCLKEKGYLRCLMYNSIKKD